MTTNPRDARPPAAPGGLAALAEARLGLAPHELIPHGHDKAKVELSALAARPPRPDARIVLVTATSPTPAGEGKTTTTIGLGDALSRLGERVAIALREPSLGPVFGLKGGATGGGRAQLEPAAAINLHFTGDFAAIAAAHNLLAALVDNHLHHGHAPRLDARRITWKRVVDMNDRALRRIVAGLGGPAHGVPRESGFDIVVASEVMAILCLATSLADLKARLARIVVGQDVDGHAVTAGDLGAAGAMAALLKDALAPNLVRSREGTPAFVHGGPFANLAHGCNSVLATTAAARLADWVVTEAGFGADLGAEKFIDIKCRATGLRPAAAVLVTSVRSLKYHGGVERAALGTRDLDALRRGFANLDHHVATVRDVYGLPCVIAVNPFPGDHDDELAALVAHGHDLGVPIEIARHYGEGGAGAEALARAVIATVAAHAPRGAPVPPPRFVYDDAATLWDKAETVARRVHRATGLDASPAVRRELAALEAQGHGRLPVCIAKTPYSFSADETRRGAAAGHVLPVREVRLAAGAGFVVFVCGDLMTMPGLPAKPAAAGIDVDDDGTITGLI